MIKISNVKPSDADAMARLYKQNELVYYYPLEELFNVITHFAGVLFGIVMLGLMLAKSTTPANYAVSVLSCFSIIAMFACSTAYHGVSDIKAKRVLRRIDYSSINLTVIACGTAACLLYGSVYGYVAYGLCFAITAVTAFLCIRYFGNFRYAAVVSNFVVGGLLTAAYVISANFIPDISTRFSVIGLALCLIGAVLFGVKIRYAHTVFHLFVLFGPICFMFANYFQLF